MIDKTIMNCHLLWKAEFTGKSDKCKTTAATSNFIKAIILGAQHAF